jgi:hypothetical protein
MKYYIGFLRTVKTNLEYMMTKAKNHYVNNKTLYTEMVKYKTAVTDAKEKGLEPPPIPNYVGECLLLIANRLSYKANFINYSYRDDMVLDGIENCIIAIDNFDPEKSTNPFAYFTQIMKWAFVRRIQKEQKQAYVKHKNFENTLMMTEWGIMDEDMIAINNEYSANVVNAFETKLTKNKQKAKIVGLQEFANGDVDEGSSNN